MRSAFTMVELVFVIVLLGILAAVAIPKLAATRDDAKVVSVAQQVKAVASEVSAFAYSQGKVSGLIDMSQVLSQLNIQGKLSNSSSSITKANLSDKDVYLFTLNNSANLENCMEFKIDSNATTFQILYNSGSVGKICLGVKARIKETNITVGGERVVL